MSQEQTPNLSSKEPIMLFKGLLGTQYSGSVAGLTASHNAGGTYFRERATPTNPASAQQVAVRNAMNSLVARWVDTLTQTQRDAWQTYADNVTLINRIGDAINVPALSMYVRSNVARLQTGETLLDAAPTIFDLGGFTDPSFALDEPNDEVDVTFDNTDDWANEDDSAMLVYASAPQNQSIEYFKGPYRFAGKIEGDAITAPTSPAAIGLPWPIATGQRVFLMTRVTRADGRYSTRFRGSADS